ncbi:Biopolymer transport protein ExbD/TolR [Rhodopirellula maiorica SM1]|uniref:Biopolymer transport protein ExbD/TolR n=1 Tax=Rhodopirellula maiorica SM1 TaxID=1265738 RepID=M5RGI2_9BACT|nr:Biopolymer transport protein ExbD/TolR [Rhodopirellula maiorica SM1]
MRCPDCDAQVDVPELVDAQQADDTPEAIAEVEWVDDGFVDDDVTGMSNDHSRDSDVPSPSKIAAAAPVVPAESAVATAPRAAAEPAIAEDEDDDVPKRQPRQDDELDMTPMVDVTFLLLIFFMVTASFSLQKSIEMPRQQTDAPSSNPDPEETEELDSVEVQIDDRGSFLVMAADWERETPGKQNLISALKEAVPGGSDAMKLVIKVHEMAKLQALVDAMDAGTIAGYTELQVTQVEEFD